MFCGTCPAYSATHTAGGAGAAFARGRCLLLPQSAAKLPSEWCMQHPARAAMMRAPEAPDPDREEKA